MSDSDHDEIHESHLITSACITPISAVSSPNKQTEKKGGGNPEIQKSDLKISPIVEKIISSLNLVSSCFGAAMSPASTESLLPTSAEVFQGRFCFQLLPKRKFDILNRS